MYIDDSEQDHSNFIANVLELPQSCTKPSIAQIGDSRLPASIQISFFCFINPDIVIWRVGVNLWLRSAEFPPFPVLWLVDHFLRFYRQTTDGIDLKFGRIHDGPPKTWLNVCHAPMNSRRFLASDYLIGPRDVHPVLPCKDKKFNQCQIPSSGLGTVIH